MSKIFYLLQLLDDESEDVRKAVLEELLFFGPSLEEEMIKQSLRPTANQREILVPVFEEHNRQWLREQLPSLFDTGDDYFRLERGWELFSAFQNGRFYPFKVKYLLDQIANEFLEQYHENNEVTLAQFLFQTYGLKGDRHNFFSPQNSNLVYVMRERMGIPISLVSVYMLVGHRLGFHIEGYNFPGHFLAKILYNQKNVLVDCFHNGILIDERHLLFTTAMFSANLSKEDLESNASIMLSRGLRNLMRSYEVQGDEKNSQFTLRLLQDFENLRKQHEDEENNTVIFSEALYHIGQIVKHTKYGYRGVIVDYDLTCKAEEKWYQSNQTQPPRNQPWYHVLVHSSAHNTYVAQNNLILDTIQEGISHPLIDHFFCEFKKGRYYRNDENWPQQY